MCDHDGRGAGDVDLLASARQGEGPGVSPWIWRIAALLALGVLAAVAGPGLLSSLNPRQPHSSAASGRPLPLVMHPNETFVPAPRWAARGPEVGSAIAAAEVTRIRHELPGVDRLLWAGSLDGHDRVVLVSYRPQPNASRIDAARVAALRVRRASDIPTARIQPIGYFSDASVVGLAWQGDDHHTRLLLLARPAPMRMLVSSVVDYHPSGQISRRWRDVELTDGVVVTDLGLHVDPAVVVRPNNISSSTSPVLVQVQGRPELPRFHDVTVAGVSSPSYAGPEPRLLVASLAQSVQLLFDLRDADSKVLWSGTIASGRREPGELITGRAALVLMRRHDGAMFQAFIYSDAMIALNSFHASAVRWSLADRMPYAFSTHEVGAPVLLVNPSGTGSATVDPGFGRPLRVRFDANGIATLAADGNEAATVDGARVVIRDPSGRTVLSAALPVPAAIDPFANNWS